MERKGNSKCKINVLVSKKNSTTTLKKTSIINNISLQNTSCKNIPTRKAKNQDDISLMTSCSP